MFIENSQKHAFERGELHNSMTRLQIEMIIFVNVKFEKCLFPF